MLKKNNCLQVKKEKLTERILLRLEIGQKLIDEKVHNEISKEKLWENFLEWDDFNLEIIKQAFNIADNTYALDYERNTGGSSIIVSGQAIYQSSFKEKVKDIKNTIKSQNTNLKNFYTKIELFQECKSLKKTKQVNKITLENEDKISTLLKVLNRFDKVAQQLTYTRKDQITIIIKNEYDVQLLISGLLKIDFDDVRSENYSPSNSGANSRIDFVLKEEKIGIEIKITKEKLKDKDLGDQLLIDIGRYKNDSTYDTLVIFIYDKEKFIQNKYGLINDLENHSVPEQKVIVIINPE